MLFKFRNADTVLPTIAAGYHQLVSHYLRAHACQEAFIIAFMRSVSALHPVRTLCSEYVVDAKTPKPCI